MINPYLYRCTECEYITLVKANYNRHVKYKHSNTIEEYKCEYCDHTFKYQYSMKRHMIGFCKHKPSSENIAELPQNIPQNPQNIPQNPQNVAIVPQNVALDPQNIPQYHNTLQNAVCTKCHKEFSRTDSMKRHYIICKGTKSSLECHKCHLILPSKYSKYRHLKTCKEYVSHENIITFSNVTNTQLNFSTDHITFSMIETLITNAISTDEYSMNKDIVSGFYNYLLTVIINRCVKKNNSRANYSHVHIGNNKWEQRHDSEVYDKLLTEIIKSFIKLLNMNQSINTKLYDFLNYMAEKGNCNKDKHTNYTVLKCYRELIQRLKSKIVQTTKSTE